MSEYQPRDYPAATGSSLETSEDVNGVTLSSVKERLAAQKPVSNEMISTAVNNLFSADSHDAYRPSASEQLDSPSSLPNWMKPGKIFTYSAK